MQLTGFNLDTNNYGSKGFDNISNLLNNSNSSVNGNGQGSGNGTGGVANELVLDSMVDSMMNGAFKGDGNYQGNAETLADDPLMQQVAQYMDQNPDKFPPPHDGKDGSNVRNWTQELAENNHLSGSEKEDFKAGLKDMLANGGLNGTGGTGGANGTGGTNGTGGSNGTEGLGDLLKQLGNTGMNDSVGQNQDGSGQIMELLKQIVGIIAQMMDGNQGSFGQPSGQTA